MNLQCSTNPCGNNAGCENTDGSFTCVCNDGYMGDGLTCTGIHYLQLFYI